MHQKQGFFKYIAKVFRLRGVDWLVLTAVFLAIIICFAIFLHLINQENFISRTWDLNRWEQESLWSGIAECFLVFISGSNFGFFYDLSNPQKVVAFCLVLLGYLYKILCIGILIMGTLDARLEHLQKLKKTPPADDHFDEFFDP